MKYLKELLFLFILLLTVMAVALGETKLCGKDYDCFLKAANDCQMAQVEFTLHKNEKGIKQEITRRMKILGASDKKCLYQDRIEEVYVEMSDERRRKLLDSGLNHLFIDGEVRENIREGSLYKGVVRNCAFPIKIISGILTEYKAGKISSDIWKECSIKMPEVQPPSLGSGNIGLINSSQQDLEEGKEQDNSLVTPTPRRGSTVFVIRPDYVEKPSKDQEKIKRTPILKGESFTKKGNLKIGNQVIADIRKYKETFESLSSCTSDSACDQECTNCKKGHYICLEMTKKCAECIVATQCHDGFQCRYYQCVK